jgi:D-aminoacyl-tRNA deacylase
MGLVRCRYLSTIHWSPYLKGHKDEPRVKSAIQQVESDRKPPSDAFTRRADEVLKTDGLLGRIREHSRSARVVPDWFRSWPEIERQATTLRSYEPLLVPGLLVLLGVTHDDTEAEAARMAAKLWGLRILDEERSCSDIGAPLLVVSQFTLYGDARKGRRPTWQAAARSATAEPLVEATVKELRALGARVETGAFGAQMTVELSNEGPFTVIVEI